jgi:hypothetical protein
MGVLRTIHRPLVSYELQLKCHRNHGMLVDITPCRAERKLHMLTRACTNAHTRAVMQGMAAAADPKVQQQLSQQ